MRTASAAAALVLTLALAGCATPTNAEVGPNGDPAKKPAPGEMSGEVPVAQEPQEGGADDDASRAALDAYVMAEQASAAATFDASVYDSVGVTALHPSTVVYSYVYANPIDPVAATEYFDGIITDFQEVCDTSVFPAMEEYGVVDPAAVYVYYSPDRTVLWEHTFTSK